MWQRRTLLEEYEFTQNLLTARKMDPDWIRTVINALSRREVIDICLYHGLEDDEPQGDEGREPEVILHEYCVDYPSVTNCIEIAHTMGIEYDRIASLLESTGGKLNVAVMNQMRELKEGRCGEFFHLDIAKLLARGATNEYLRVPTTAYFVLTDPEPADDFQYSTQIRIGKVGFARIISGADIPPDVYDIKIRIQRSDIEDAPITEVEQTILIYQPIYDYMRIHEIILDDLVWKWSGKWCEALEDSCHELMAAFQADLVSLQQEEDLQLPLDMKKLFSSGLKDVFDVLKTKALYDLGKLHSLLEPLLEYEHTIVARYCRQVWPAAKAFLREKLLTTNLPDIPANVKQLFVTGDYYLSTRGPSLHMSTNQRGLLIHMDNLINHLRTKLNSPTYVPKNTIDLDDWLFMFRAKPTMLQACMNPGPADMSYMPMISADSIANPWLLHAEIKQLTQSMYGDTTFPFFRMTKENVTETRILIQALLDSGLTYVCSGANLLGLFHMQDTALSLWEIDFTTGDQEKKVELTAAWRKRLKDMPRIFRNKVKAKLSLRCNSDFDLAIRKLREHHVDNCWLKEDLERVWREMVQQSPPQLYIFELWHGEDMIAADFLHPCNGGRTVYVATRFFDRSEEFKQLQPGFFLAMASTKFLQSLETPRCWSWSLGGVSANPILKYKYDLTGEPVERAMAQHNFDKMRLFPANLPPPGTMAENGLRTGILVEEITLKDLTFDL